MSDIITLIVNGYEYTRFKSYVIKSDIYEAADTFEVEAYPSSEFVPAAGMKFEMRVNNALEFVGIVDNVSRGYASSGQYLQISGRDIMGLIVDSCCEEFPTVQNNSLAQIANRLLKNIPYLSGIEYDEAAKKRDSSKPYIQIEPGQRIFDVLRDAAISRGLVFYATAKGGLAFRKPRGKGRCVFSLYQKDSFRKLRRKDGRAFPLNHEDFCGIIKAEEVSDISTRYSSYTVLTQEQRYDQEDPIEINQIATVNDDQFPFKGVLKKPFVESVSDDKESPAKLARRYMEKNRMLSRTLNYTVKGHSQNTHNWTIDELVNVDDRVLGIRDTLLVYSRTFIGSSTHQVTELKLGAPGLVE